MLVKEVTVLAWPMSSVAVSRLPGNIAGKDYPGTVGFWFWQAGTTQGSVILVQGLLEFASSSGEFLLGGIVIGTGKSSGIALLHILGHPKVDVTLS